MEQIVITRANGDVVPIANKKTATSIKSATQNVTLLGDDTVTIVVVSPFKQTYLLGDAITIYGNVYHLNRLPKVKKTGMHEFQYDLEFEGAQYEMMRATYDLTIDTTSNELADVSAESLTGSLHRFATVLVANLCRIFPGKWVLGTCPDTAEDKTLTFSEGDNCLSVCQSLCSEFETEFDIEYNSTSGVFTLNFRKVGKTFPYTFRFGKNKGLYSLNRENVSSANIITRLKVYGSTENITYKYRAQRLCLPGKAKKDSYIEKPEAVAKYGIWEGKKYFDDIKPSRTGKVSETVPGSVLKFVDEEMFNLNEKDDKGNSKYLLDETAAKVHFNTGNLAGYEFDVHSYDHATRTFTLVKQTDERGNVFPSESSAAFQFTKGDEYKLVDVALPPEWETKAEQELAEQGNIYYDQNSQPKVQYGLSVTESFLTSLMGKQTNGNIIWVGDYIPVMDDDIDVNKSVRVKSFKRDLLKDYTYTLTISDLAITTSLTNRVISELIDHDKAITINNLKDPAKARANWRSSREVLNMVFDPDGDYYSDRIKPQSIDTMALSVGAKSMQFGLTNTVFQPNYGGDPNRIVYEGGVLTHYTIHEDTAVSWLLSDGDVTLSDSSKAFYVYAKCSRNSNAGSIIFTTEQIGTDVDSGYWHFFIGVLNSVDSGMNARSLALTYGFTMINGRFIKTGRVESSDGETYFDLDNSEIGGRIVFMQNGQKKTLEEVAAESLESKDFINNTLPGLLSEVETQIDGKIETWFTSDDPSTAWTTSDARKKHVGDLWYSCKTNEAKRYSATFAWEVIKDADALKALQDASKAQDTADGKRRVFVDTPSVPYDRGDLWASGTFLKRSMKTRKSGDMVESDWEDATNYTGDESLNDFIQNTYNSAIADIYGQLDGVIETHFGNGAPTLENAPASEWTTTKDKDEHLGDMYYDNDSGIAYRFSKDNGAYVWVEVRDNGVAEALAAAAKAQDTADGKRRVFVDTPRAPYDRGDLWASGTFLKRCIKARPSGSIVAYVASDWENATNYTGDENLNKFIDGVFGDTVSEIYHQIDGKVESWYTTTDPASEWKTSDERNKHVGDMWYNTSSNRLYHYVHSSDGYIWENIKNQDAIDAATAASKAQDTADGKRRVFVAQPYTPYDVGDLWAQGSTGDIMRCKVSRGSGAFTSSDWEKASKYTDNTALDDFINGAYTETIDSLAAQIDGKIETWFQTTNPSSNWSSADNEKHVGDMWYNTETKELKCFQKTASTTGGISYIRYVWQVIEDKTAKDAYEAASKAQDTADGKRRVFVAQPYPPYDVGDLWVDGKDLRRCITAKGESEAWNVNDWVVAVYYDNTKTTIDGGIVTSGTIQVAGDNESVLAGMTGNGTASDSIRFWAGASFENRKTAPFRVMQDGSVVMSKAHVEGVVDAISGSIGGFEIKQGQIGYGSADVMDSTNGMALLNDFIRFSNGKQRVLLGCLSSGGSLLNGLMELTDQEGTTLELHHKNPSTSDRKLEYLYRPKALAVYGNQNVFGKFALFSQGYIGEAFTDVIQSCFHLTHKFHFTSCNSSIVGMYLPTKSQVDSYTGNAGVMFDLEITCDVSMLNTIRLYSSTGAQMYDHKGETIASQDLDKGDTFTLRYYNGKYILTNWNW